MFGNSDLKKTDLYAILVGIFCASLIVSNIIASKTFELYWVSLPCAVIIFPIIYIVNDVLAECYGYQKARMAIYLGFFMNLIAVICYNITMFLPAPAYFTADAAFHTVLGSTLRLLIASFIASTFAGDGMDAIIFITIGFLGTMPLFALLTMIVAQALFKTAYEVVVYPVTRKVIQNVKALDDY